MKIALIQSNPTVGALKAIRNSMLTHIRIAIEEGMDVVVFPELATTGYPPRDLLYKPGFLREQYRTVEEIRDSVVGTNLTAIFGFIGTNDELIGRPIYNCAGIANSNGFHDRVKTLLPNDDVFDEYRYFQPGRFVDDNFPLFDIAGKTCGVVICEEMWNNLAREKRPLYPHDPVKYYAKRGASVVFSINASPFWLLQDGSSQISVAQKRLRMVTAHCEDNRIMMPCAFQVGGNDEIVFDGNSMIVGGRGRLYAAGASFKEDVVKLNTDGPLVPLSDDHFDRNECDQITEAAVMGLHDYAKKQGIQRLLINMSGGIDSAYAGYIAKRTGLPMLAFSQPSEFSAAETQTDAKRVCESLGIPMDEIPISFLHETFRQTLDDSIVRMCDRNGEEFMETMGLPFHKKGDINLCPVPFQSTGVADENLQPRIRGTVIMAWANLLNALVVGTGNRSEMAVGYCTLYGDMASGLNVLKDIPKTKVFACCRRINELAGKEVIPVSIIDRPPSAELRADQKDTDSLPPYEILDEIEWRYTSDRMDVDDIIAALGEQHRAAVLRVCSLIDNAEYKRRQSPLGIKTQERDLARGRQVPVVQGWTRQWREEMSK